MREIDEPCVEGLSETSVVDTKGLIPVRIQNPPVPPFNKGGLEGIFSSL